MLQSISEGLSNKKIAVKLFISESTIKTNVIIDEIKCKSRTVQLVCKLISKTQQTKIRYGKSCIRFKKVEAIPFELIAELASKMIVQEWINLYKLNVKTK